MGSFFYRQMCWVWCAVGLGCSDHQVNQVDTTDTFLQEKTSGADILWIIDDSISMADEQTLVAEGFRSFITALVDGRRHTFSGGVNGHGLANEQRGVMRGDTPF